MSNDRRPKYRMRSGKKPTTNQSKVTGGTAKPSRVREEIAVPTALSIPIMPLYLTKTASAVWNEEAERIIAGGGTALDSDLIARYCSLEAITRAIFEAGDCPPIAALTELRRMAESLGMAGAQSRSRIAPPAKPSNPFAAAMQGIK
jgi:hypothetical protein